jgi:hypothetical protein
MSEACERIMGYRMRRASLRGRRMSEACERIISTECGVRACEADA